MTIVEAWITIGLIIMVFVVGGLVDLWLTNRGL